ncbi:MAG: hypothetical protein DWQ20_03810 [Actinobacteria bacterium]|nr:MAG: hypothetical protein DWQ20_03810 [Actinomycetota bacterium]
MVVLEQDAEIHRLRLELLSLGRLGAGHDRTPRHPRVGLRLRTVDLYTNIEQATGHRPAHIEQVGKNLVEPLPIEIDGDFDVQFVTHE